MGSAPILITGDRTHQRQRHIPCPAERDTRLPRLEGGGGLFFLGRFRRQHLRLRVPCLLPAHPAGPGTEQRVHRFDIRPVPGRGRDRRTHHRLDRRQVRFAPHHRLWRAHGRRWTCHPIHRP